MLPAGFTVAERYEVIKPLGRGGMGCVYLATDTVLGNEQIAIKILHTDYVQDEGLLQRFLREVQLMRQVSHRNVVRTYDVGSDQNMVYFTMEYVPGVGLDKIIQNHGYLKGEAPHLIIQICEGLEAIHNANIVHRDLKPGNLLVLEDATVRITDFGVARPEVSRITAHNEIVGSVCYIAPEVWLGATPDPSVDLYSLGIILYEFVTGDVPFDGGSPHELMRLHTDINPVPPRDHNPDCPPWLNKLVLRLLEKSPIARPRNAREIINYVKLHAYRERAKEDGSRDNLSYGSDDFIKQLEAKSQESAQTVEAETREDEGMLDSFSKRRKDFIAPPRSSAHQKIRKRSDADKKRSESLRKVGLQLMLLLAGAAVLAGAVSLLSAAAAALFSAPSMDVSTLMQQSAEKLNDSHSLRQVLGAGAPFALVFIIALSAPVLLVPIMFRAWNILGRVFALSLVFYLLSGTALMLSHLAPVFKNSEVNGISLLSAAAAAKHQLSGIAILNPLTSSYEHLVLEKGLVLHSMNLVPITDNYLVVALTLGYLALLIYTIRSSMCARRHSPQVVHFITGAAITALLLFEALLIVDFEPIAANLILFQANLSAQSLTASALHWSFVIIVACLAALLGMQQISGDIQNSGTSSGENPAN